MGCTVEKISGNQVKIAFEVPSEEFESAMMKAYLKIRGRINVPGFRKGKAPRKLIENMYGEGVFYDDALDILFSADVPVIVELKSVPRSRRAALCSAVLAELDRRDGRFCVESFDPMIVRWFRRNAPDILRGQLTAQREELDLDAFRAYAGSHVLCNFLGRPQFIAHRVGKKALAVRASEAMGAMRVCWTAHDRSREAENDAVIFENYRPPVRFHET